MTDDTPQSAHPSDARPAGAPPPTVYLHIGTMKTGTSFVQAVLMKNRDLLRDEGVLYPLRGSQWGLQVKAARDILGIKGMPTEGGWAAQAEKITSWDGPSVIVSMEFYSLASAAKAKQVAEALAPSPVEVIITARDLARVLPSAWQSMIKQGRPWSFAEFVSSVTGSGEGDPDAHRRFWRHQDVADITRKWVDAVGAEHVHLVTVPPSGSPPSLLWERFCSVVGIDPARYDITQDRNSNFSLSYSDSELMRRVSGELFDELDKVAFKRWTTRFFANRVLRASAAEDTAHDRPRLSPAARMWAVDRSRQMVDDVRDLGIDVVGDLEELVPSAPRPDATTDAAADAGSEPLTTYPDSAVKTIAAILRRLVAVDPVLARSNGHGRAAPTPDADEADEADGADGDADDGYDDEGDIDSPARLAWAR